MTAGSQPTKMTAPSSRCRAASAIALTATNTAAEPPAHPRQGRRWSDHRTVINGILFRANCSLLKEN